MASARSLNTPRSSDGAVLCQGNSKIAKPQAVRTAVMATLAQRNLLAFTASLYNENHSSHQPQDHAKRWRLTREVQMCHHAFLRQLCAEKIYVRDCEDRREAVQGCKG